MKHKNLQIDFSFIENFPGFMCCKNSQYEYITGSENFLKISGHNQLENVIYKRDQDMPWCNNADLYQETDQIALEVGFSKMIYPVRSHSNKKYLFKSYKYCAEIDSTEQVIISTGQLLSVDVTSNNNCIISKDDLNYFNNKNERFMTKNPFMKLTRKETEVLYFFIRGYISKHIAIKLNRSRRTIETHIQNIKTKLDCNSKSNLIDFAHQNGFIDYIPNSFYSTNK